MKRPMLLPWLFLPAVAGAEMYDRQYQACNQATTVDIVACVRDAASQWDEQLQPAYEALVERSEPAQIPALADAQRLWAEYRQANCTFYAQGGGTLAQIEAMECFRAMTKARVCELRQANVGEAQAPGECTAAGSAASLSGTSGQAAAASSQPGASGQGTRSPASVPATPPGMHSTANASAAAREISGRSELHNLRYDAGISFLLMQNRPFRAKTKARVETQPEASFHAYVMFEKELLPAGGSAVFGWIEGLNRVVLLSHSKYLPSLTRAATTRTITFSRMLTELDQAPRYTLTCVWEQDGDRVAPPLRVYGERDDANSAARSDPSVLSLRVTWIHVPASRAERVFAGRDYCGEIAATEKSPVPVWEEVVGVGN